MYQRKDYYFHKAKQQGLRARSSFKLLEIQTKYSIVKKNSSVLDIGCAPGGWLQVLKKMTLGRIVGIDVVSIQPIAGVAFVQGDITDSEVWAQLQGPFDVIVSDIAPKTSGQRERDQYVSFELSRMSFHVAQQLLKKGGNFVVKTFQSQETEELVNEMRKSFSFIKRYVPESTRQGSKELYIIGMGFTR